MKNPNDPFLPQSTYEKNIMHTMNNWMNGGMGGGWWIWSTIGVLLVILLVVSIGKFSRK